MSAGVLAARRAAGAQDPNDTMKVPHCHRAVWHTSPPQRPRISSITVTEVTVLHYFKIFREFVGQSSHVYAQGLMRTRLLALVLVLLLSGTNSGATALCAAYCISSVGSAALHHHHMESNSQLSPTSVSRHIHSRHRGTPCAECPPASQYGLTQKADCASLVQIQALKQNSFSLNGPNKISQLDVAHAPDSLPLVGDRERSLVFDTSQAVRSLNPASVPLRI